MISIRLVHWIQECFYSSCMDFIDFLWLYSGILLYTSWMLMPLHFFLIDNKSFIEEKEQCVYDCKLIALEIYTLFLSIKGTMLMHLLLSIKFSYYL